MPTKETYALLIGGNESRFADDILKFQEFLVNVSSFDPNKIRIILCNYMGNDYIFEETRMFFEKVNSERSSLKR